MRQPLPLLTAWLVLVSAGLVRGYQWPSPQYEALESFLWEGGDSRVGFPLSLLVTACRTRSDSPGSVGAQWLRFAYHDMATHNVTDGTGGLDASIFYELDRPENVGNGQVLTAADFFGTATKYVSRADVIAFGTTWSIAACGGPVLKYRGGRKDAAGPRMPGVPEPDQTLTTHVEKFRLQGFNATEMIQLVACGHTIGGVRSVDFPQVVTANASDPSGIVLQDFDTTPHFDTAIITEYLDGTTQNPLVVPASNVSFASDLRIFASDGNVTMKSLASPTSFSDTCATMITRMLNTVPADTQLTDEIELLPVKVRDAFITVVNSQLVFITSLRLSRPADKPVPSGRTISLFWCDRRGKLQDCAGGSANVASNFTSTGTLESSPLLVPANIALNSYEITVPITAKQSVGKFWFVLDEHDGSGPQTLDNGGDGYLFPQDEVITVYELGFTSPVHNDVSLSNFTFVTGIRTDINITNATMLGYTSDTYPNALNYTVPLQHNKTGVLVDGYAYYVGSIVDSGRSLTIDLQAVGSDNTTYTADYIRGNFAGPNSVSVPPVAPVSVTTLASIPSGLTSTTVPTAALSQKLSSALIASAGAASWMMVIGAVMFGCLDNM
ncbi:heme peroxidase [Pholiota molesta]|nr:heme peroxidase [Pholiota molesta]